MNKLLDKQFLKHISSLSGTNVNLTIINNIYNYLKEQDTNLEIDEHEAISKIALSYLLLVAYFSISFLIIKQFFDFAFLSIVPTFAVIATVVTVVIALTILLQNNESSLSLKSLFLLSIVIFFAVTFLLVIAYSLIVEPLLAICLIALLILLIMVYEFVFNYFVHFLIKKYILNNSCSYAYANTDFIIMLIILKSVTKNNSHSVATIIEYIIKNVNETPNSINENQLIINHAEIELVINNLLNVNKFSDFEDIIDSIVGIMLKNNLYNTGAYNKLLLILKENNSPYINKM